MSLWFDFIRASVDNLCTWINVGNCVFDSLELQAGEKNHKSRSVSAVWVQSWMNIPRVAKLLALTCHILTSSFVWEPPNIYPTPQRAQRRAWGSFPRQEMTMAPGVSGWMCWWALRQPSSATPMRLIHSWESHALCLACSRDGCNENVTVMAIEKKFLVASPYPSASPVLLLSHIKA